MTQEIVAYTEIIRGPRFVESYVEQEEAILDVRLENYSICPSEQGVKASLCAVLVNVRPVLIEGDLNKIEHRVVPYQMELELGLHIGSLDNHQPQEAKELATTVSVETQESGEKSFVLAPQISYGDKGVGIKGGSAELKTAGSTSVTDEEKPLLSSRSADKRTVKWEWLPPEKTKYATHISRFSEAFFSAHASWRFDLEQCQQVIRLKVTPKGMPYFYDAKGNEVSSFFKRWMLKRDAEKRNLWRVQERRYEYVVL